MDFDMFKAIVDKAYTGGAFTKQECLDVFAAYFDAYKLYRGCEHPPLKLSQVEAIIDKMPFLDSYSKNYDEIEAWEYPRLIDLYFKTRFKKCDYNINHFFSGRVRELKYYELSRDYE